MDTQLSLHLVFGRESIEAACAHRYARLYGHRMGQRLTLVLPDGAARSRVAGWLTKADTLQPIIAHLTLTSVPEDADGLLDEAVGAVLLAENVVSSNNPDSDALETRLPSKIIRRNVVPSVHRMPRGELVWVAGRLCGRGEVLDSLGELGRRSVVPVSVAEGDGDWRMLASSPTRRCIAEWCFVLPRADDATSGEVVTDVGVLVSESEDEVVGAWVEERGTGLRGEEDLVVVSPAIVRQLWSHCEVAFRPILRPGSEIATFASDIVGLLAGRVAAP